MKYLFVSDIHGCLPTLEKVLQFYDREQCDMLCILGDILNYGPRNSIPAGINAKGIVEVLNKRTQDIIAVRGNCDAEVDQMLLKFPLMTDYLMLVDEGNGSSSPTDTYIIRRRCPLVTLMPLYMDTHIYGS